MKEHYDQFTTENILLNSEKPLMNSLPFETALLNPKYFTQIDFTEGQAMNIAFTESADPNLTINDDYEWHFFEDVSTVKIIDRKKIFIQGINVVLYLVQLRINDDS
jgi:hypothetical protein